MEKIAEIDISKALELASIPYSKKINFEQHSSIYPFTNENIDHYFSYLSSDNELKLKDRKVLTTCSSGDHLINSYLYGASEVDTFDVNRLTHYYLKLKLAALKVLDYSEFISFLFKESFSENKQLYDLDIYLKVREALDETSIRFWDTIFRSGNDLANSKLFYESEGNATVNNAINKYLSYECYFELAKSKILESNADNSLFIESSLGTLPEQLPKIYDTILLSNINEYYTNYGWQMNKQYLKIVKSLVDCISLNGIIVFAYYNYRRIDDLEEEIKLSKVESELSPHKLIPLEVEALTNLSGYGKTGLRDTVLILKK